ncbi:MAG: glycosyltransferase [bacterium]|nr:glycosyltransferase [bacterium]
MENVLEYALWVGAGLWMVFLVLFVVNWLAIPELSRVPGSPPAHWPHVSIVVPARDEADGIRRAVSSFCRQDYPSFEVIVVDDRSTDATPQILAELKEQFQNLKVVPGSDPPEGWLGKPFALQLGSQHARGDWLLFVDADIEYAPDLLRRALPYVLERDVGMLFLFPRLLTGEWLEAVIMSTLYLGPFAIFPTFLISRTRSGLLALGGGMFNLVRRDAFEASGAFESLRNAVVDDVGMGRVVKQAGFKQAVALAGPLIRVRMYAGARATIDGFSKNAYPMFRRHWWLLPIPLSLGLVVSVVPYVGLTAGIIAGTLSTPAMISLGCMHVILAGLAWRLRQPWYVALLNPVRELCWWWILLRSAVRYFRYGLLWRGRSYGSDIS